MVECAGTVQIPDAEEEARWIRVFAVSFLKKGQQHSWWDAETSDQHQHTSSQDHQKNGHGNYSLKESSRRGCSMMAVQSSRDSLIEKNKPQNEACFRCQW